jgi:tetratricopeptide (TPR) repeat protein
LRLGLLRAAFARTFRSKGCKPLASIFLSYDRDDDAKARSVALALEKAGHQLWWDQRIKGGAQYSKEIEAALQAADAVVVLWSVHSIDSAWVRDEAAAGRDSGRLVPVLIDNAEPPLGFRQYQAINLFGWKGRGKSAEFDRLLGSIHDLAGADLAVPAIIRPSKITTRTPSRGMLIPLILAALLLAIGLAAWSLVGRGNGVPTIAVAAVDASPSTTTLTRDLLVKLGSLQSIRGKSIRLVESDATESPGADLIFEVSANTPQTEANLVLLSGKDRAILWSDDFKPPSGNPGDLKQQLAYTAARVLDCALEAHDPKGKRLLDQQVLGLYLNGCAKFAELIGTNTTQIIPLFDKVTKAAPLFEPGWAKLLLSESMTTDLPGRIQDRADPARIRQHILQARKVNPRLVEAALAEISLLPSTALSERARLIDQSLETEPENSTLISARSKLYASVGRLNDATIDAKRASQLEPLSPAFRHTYISVLSHAGQIEAAFQELENAEQLWPGASNMVDARFRLHIFYGDPKEALRLMRKGITNYPASLEPVLHARIDPNAENMARARDLIRHQLPQRPEASTGPVHGYGQFGMADELFSILDPSIHTEPELFSVLFRPPLRDFRNDERFIALAARFGLVDYWQKAGIWPDYCREPDLHYDCKAAAATLQKRKGGA